MLAKKMEKIMQPYARTISGYVEGEPTYECFGTLFFGKQITISTTEKGITVKYHFFEGLTSGPLSFVVGQEPKVNVKSTTMAYCLGYKESTNTYQKAWILLVNNAF